MEKVTAKLTLILNEIDMFNEDKIYKMNKKVKVPVLFNKLPFMIYERGDETKRLETNYFNPVSESTLRGKSESSKLLINSLSTTISRNVMLTVLTALQVVNKEGVSIKLVDIFDRKVTSAHVTAFKNYILYLKEHNIQAYTVNTKNNIKLKVKGEDRTFLVGGTVTSNAITQLDKLTYDEMTELKFKDDYPDIFKFALKKVLNQGVMSSSNHKLIPTYDAISRLYNLFSRRSNAVIKHFKDSKPTMYKALTLGQLPIGEEFDEDALDLKRIPLFLDVTYVGDDSDDDFSFDVVPDFDTSVAPTVPASVEAQTRTQVKSATQQQSQQTQEQVVTATKTVTDKEKCFEPFSYNNLANQNTDLIPLQPKAPTAILNTGGVDNSLLQPLQQTNNTLIGQQNTLVGQQQNTLLCQQQQTQLVGQQNVLLGQQQVLGGVAETSIFVNGYGTEF